MNRSKAILRELRLYPVWQRRGQASPVLPEGMAANQPEQVTDSFLVEKIDRQGLDGFNWPELTALVENCTACRLRISCARTIPGAGDMQADWLFVDEWPGPEEIMQGEPFVGQAGQLLDNMLSAIQLKRGRNVYLTNIIKCRPPGGNTPEAHEIAQCMPYLERQIQLVQPKLIVALGKTAALLLGQDGTLSDLRGKLHEYRVSSVHGMLKNIPLIVTHHPNDLLQTPPKKAEAWNDLCLAVATMKKLAEG